MPDDKPVLSSELQAMKDELNEFFAKEINKVVQDVQGANHTIEGVNKRLSTLTDRVQRLEVNPSKNKDDDDDWLEDDDEIIFGSDGEPDMAKTRAEKVRRQRLRKNKTGMGEPNIGALQVMMILMPKSNLPYLLSMVVMMQRNT